MPVVQDLRLPSIEDLGTTNPVTGPFDAMSARDEVDFYALNGMANQTGVLTGGAVTQHTGSDMNVSVAANTAVSGGTGYSWAGTTVAIPAAGTHDRRDTIVYRPGTGLLCVQGVECATTGFTWTVNAFAPVKSFIQGTSPNQVQNGDIVLAEVYVRGNSDGSGTTAITTAGNIVDKRNLLNLALQTATTALQLALTETVNYGPNTALSGNTGLLIAQNETMAGLPRCTAASSSGGVLTYTFASSALGTLGQVGDTFTGWATGFTPSGYNVGSFLSPVTFTITPTGAGLVATTAGSAGGSATVFGTINATPIQYSAYTTLIGLSYPRAVLELEGTNIFARSVDALYGIGPGVQNALGYKNATPISSSFTVTSGSANLTALATPPTGVYVGTRITGAGIPYSTFVQSIAYDGSTTTIVMTNNAYANGSPATLKFAADVTTGEGFVNTPTTVGTGADISFPINNSTFGAPGQGQGWELGYWEGPVFSAQSSGSLSNINVANVVGQAFFGANTSGILRFGAFMQDASTVANRFATGGTLATQIGLLTGFLAADAATVLPYMGAVNNIGILNPSTAFYPSAPAMTLVTAAVTVPSVGSITVNVASTAGFASTGSCAVMGANGAVTTFAYTGLTATTFTGCSATTSTALVAGCAVLSSVNYQVPTATGFTLQANARKATINPSGGQFVNTTVAQVIDPAQTFTVASCTTTNGQQFATVASGGFPAVMSGMGVTGTGIAANTTVLAVYNNTLVLSKNATASGTVTLTFNTTSTPPYDGKTVTVVNAAAHYVSFDTTAASGTTGLWSAKTVRRMTQGGSITYMWDATLAAWVETAFNSGGMVQQPKSFDASGGGGATTIPLSTTPDVYDLYIFTTTAAGGSTLTVTTPAGVPLEGQKLMLRVKTSAGTQLIFGWNPIFRGSTTFALPNNPSVGKWDYFGFSYNSVDSKWDLVAYVPGF